MSRSVMVTQTESTSNSTFFVGIDICAAVCKTVKKKFAKILLLLVISLSYLVYSGEGYSCLASCSRHQLRKH